MEKVRETGEYVGYFKTIEVPKEITVLELVCGAMKCSKSEARRLIKQGAVKIYG